MFNVPFAIVICPEPFAVCEEARALTLTIVPAPSFKSGFVFGKLVSFVIATKPPTSSTKSITLASIAAVVAILSSEADQVLPELINSEVSLFKNLVSADNVV